MKKIALASFALFLMGSPLVSAGKKSKTQLPEFEIINDKKVYLSIGKYGSVFRNFYFTLIPKNTLLASDPKITKALETKRAPANYRQTIFAVYTPAAIFPFSAERLAQFVEEKKE